jgi:hypothetical protein
MELDEGEDEGGVAERLTGVYDRMQASTAQRTQQQAQQA